MSPSCRTCTLTWHSTVVPAGTSRRLTIHRATWCKLPGSRRGQNFIIGNGERVPNEGQVAVKFEADLGSGETSQPRSVFHVAKMKRPFLSVSQICDQGFHCVFTGAHAFVLNSKGRTLCKFWRQSGLCVAKLKFWQLELVICHQAPAPPVSRLHTNNEKEGGWAQAKAGARETQLNRVALANPASM